MVESYEKVLTKNDVGMTGTHQAGITVPKGNPSLLGFFPLLDYKKFNPDFEISCIDPKGTRWIMRYVYYNGKTFSPIKSTRNEYRITHMTKFFTKWEAEPGDTVQFTSTEVKNEYNIQINKSSGKVKPDDKEAAEKPVVLRGWKAVY